MKIISFIERRQQDVIERILRHCGLWEGPLRTLAHPCHRQHVPSPTRTNRRSCNWFSIRSSCRPRRTTDSPLPLGHMGLGSSRKLPNCRTRSGLFANGEATPRSRRAATTAVGRSGFPQVTHMHGPQTADLRLVCKGSHTADLTFPAASSKGMTGNDE